MANGDFLGNSLNAIINPNLGPGLGQLVGAPLAAGINRQGDIARQDQFIADRQAREDAALQQESQIRDSTAAALSLFMQPPELRRQALSSRLAQAQQQGDPQAIQAINDVFKLDDAALDDKLRSDILKGAHTLPPGALQGAGFGGASDKNIGGKTNFVKRVGTDEKGKPLFQNFSSTLTQGRAGVAADETAFGPQFTREQGNPLTAAKIEAAGGTAAAAAQAKADVEAKATPRLRASIAKATKRANAAADDEEKLKALNANLPIVNDMADKLRALSSEATHTFGGKAFDFLAKESGFGATKGSTARAKYQAIIDNQVLPLLKATFGAAFTAAEGQRLAATLGDVDAAPAEKMAQLDAFLDSQQSQITALERKTAPAQAAAGANVVDLSDEDLFK